MDVKCRRYNHQKDFLKVRNFLESHYSLEKVPFNWSWVRWEYMNFHRFTKKIVPYYDKIGIWEDGSSIVAIVNFEHELGFAYFQLDQKYSHLKKEMLEYAQKELCKKLANDKRVLKAYINEYDHEFEDVAKNLGYKKSPRNAETDTIMDLNPSKLSYELPKGFRVQNLHNDNNLEKMNSVVHRGFNHAGKPDQEGLAARKLIQKAPSFRKDLFFVTVAPNGDYVSLCGSWYDKRNKLATIEPVATDPDYRRMGLGRATIYEALKRNYEIGARKALVGSNQDFYQKLGFRYFFKKNCWKKIF